MESISHVLAELTEARETGATRAEALHVYDTLVASEVLLLNDYYDSIDSGRAPGDSSGGILELSPVLYFLNNPPKGLELEVKAIVVALDILDGRLLPKSAIAPTLWAEIIERTAGPGIIASDGTVYGITTYDQLDPGWLISVAGWLYHLVLPDKIHTFVTPAQTIPLHPVHPVHPVDSITVGIVGDWGTGTYGINGGPAPAAMEALQGLDTPPDYLMHLGDVYYAGTSNEEQDNLLNLWPAKWGPGQRNAFTLNSNHEMYDGANGYFTKALGADGPFAAQAGASYFAATFGEWLILGLDSAYYCDADRMYMYGSIGGAEGTQGKWIAALMAERKKTPKILVLTHHNPMTTAGDAFEEHTPLYKEVLDALGGHPPDYWYFGHTHNGAVYNEKSAMGSAGTNARLCGHGAMPFGNAWIFESGAGTEYVDYYAHTPVAGTQVLMQNGFATVELHADGGINETFYELKDNRGAPRAQWQSS